MTRLLTITNEKATAEAAEIFARVKDATGGSVPNFYRVLANSSAAFEAYLALETALAKSVVPRAMREQIAITIAAANGCEYCLAAHAFLGSRAGVSDEDLQAAQSGDVKAAKTAAALNFARRLVEKKGKVADTDLAAVKTVGFSDGEILEIIALVALNTLTNYVNNTAQTEVDFPLRKIAQRQ